MWIIAIPVIGVAAWAMYFGAHFTDRADSGSGNIPVNNPEPKGVRIQLEKRFPKPTWLVMWSGKNWVATHHDDAGRHVGSDVYFDAGGNIVENTD